jgi:peptidoglycan/xylan/chitin deacetylase (PgdA/CDA1 family)
MPNTHRLRQALKRAGAKTAGVIARAPTGDRVIGLCYHSVHPTVSYASVTPDLFERHLAWLAEHCDVIPWRRTLEMVAEKGRSRPAVAITFDDGYADNHEFALPLLVKYRMTATVFITAGFTDGDPAVHMRFRELRGVSAGELRPLKWEQMREMQAAGIEIGAHTYSHPNLIRLTLADARRELQISKDVLEDRLASPIDLMAYPFGKPRRQFDHTTADLAREVGYTHAASILFRGVQLRDSEYSLPRFFVTGDSTAVLSAKVRGDWDFLGVWQERAPRPLARIVSPQDFRF